MHVGALTSKSARLRGNEGAKELICSQSADVRYWGDQKKAGLHPENKVTLQYMTRKDMQKKNQLSNR